MDQTALPLDAPRSQALAALWAILDRAVDDGEHAAISEWLSARSDAAGGFLWLAGQLGCRPSAIEATIRATMAAPAPRRNYLRSRLKKRLRSFDAVN